MNEQHAKMLSTSFASVVIGVVFLVLWIGGVSVSTGCPSLLGYLSASFFAASLSVIISVEMSGKVSKKTREEAHEILRHLWTYTVFTSLYLGYPSAMSVFTVVKRHYGTASTTPFPGAQCFSYLRTPHECANPWTLDANILRMAITVMFLRLLSIIFTDWLHADKVDERPTP